MSYQQLTEGQRYQVSVLLVEGLSHSRIAQRVGVHRSTISRELRRNRHRGDYVPAQAHQQTLIRRAKARKYQVDSDTQLLVELLLSRQWSPEQISAIAKRIGKEEPCQT